MNTNELADKLHDNFWSQYGYEVRVTNEVRNDGKKKKTYSRIPGKLSRMHFSNHVNTAIGITPSPLINDSVWFGAIDVDTYDMDFEQKKKLIKTAHELRLAVEQTLSGGFHLWCFISTDTGIAARTMRNYLRHCLNLLGLPGNTEVFPKQENGTEDSPGNGITLPYMSYKIKEQNSNCGVNVINDKILKLYPDAWFRCVEQFAFKADELSKYSKIEVRETPDSPEKMTEFNVGSMQDPDMQRLTAAELLKLIVKKKMSIRDESYFDDLVTLYISKQVGSYKTDVEVLTPLFERLDPDITGADEEFYRGKLDRARRHFEIEDPEKARQKLLDRMCYLKDTNEVWDLVNQKTYSLDSINFEFAKLFSKITPMHFLKKNPKTKIAEGFMCKPDLYNPNSQIFKHNNGLKYINSWKPNDLQPIKGDTKPWHDLLDHVFDDKNRYKEHFLDWIAFQLQNPGIKIHHALIIVSTTFRFGKGTLFKFITKLFGTNNTLEIDIDQALDKSKTYLYGTQVVLIDELQSSGTFAEKKTLLNYLKRIITEGVASSRELYKDYKIVETCTNYILFSNRKDALSLPPNESRYWVFITDRPRKNDSFYDYIYEYLRTGGAAHVLHELLERDVTEFNPHSIAPRTPYLEQMSESGEHPLTKLTRDMYKEEVFPFTPDRHVIGSLELHDWLKKNQKLGQARINEVKNALENIGARELGQVKVQLGTKIMKPTLYLIREHEKYEGKSSHELGNLWTPLHAEDNE